MDMLETHVPVVVATPYGDTITVTPIEDDGGPRVEIFREAPDGGEDIMIIPAEVGREFVTAVIDAFATVGVATDDGERLSQIGQAFADLPGMPRHWDSTGCPHALVPIDRLQALGRAIWPDYDTDPDDDDEDEYEPMPGGGWISGPMTGGAR